MEDQNHYSVENLFYHLIQDVDIDCTLQET